MGVSLPSFFGYYNASRGLAAQQIAMNVVNHNITNANTPGYSRQRESMTAGDPLTPGGLGTAGSLGQIGQGVTVVSIDRIHDNFVDGQIRSQQSYLNYQGSLKDTLTNAESVLNEPSDHGLSNTMRDFFTSAQALSNNAEDLASRTSFIQSAQSLLNGFQDAVGQLQTIRTGLVGSPSEPNSFENSKASLSIKEINNQLDQLVALNQQIVPLSASGTQPNDLLDKRDILLESLSKKLNITVDFKANNQMDVKLGNVFLVQGSTISSKLAYAENTGTSPAPANVPGLVTLVSSSSVLNGTVVNNSITDGELGGELKMGRNDADITSPKSLIDNLNQMFTQIVNEVNSLQNSGRDLAGNTPGVSDPGYKIFTGVTSGTPDVFTYSVNANIIANPKLIAAADGSGAFAGVGDGTNALKMAKVETKTLTALGNLDLKTYYNSAIAKMGVHSAAAGNNLQQAQSVYTQLDQNRESAQGVNLEEEMVNLMRYQRGFEASAKVLSTIDSVIQTILKIV